MGGAGPDRPPGTKRRLFRGERHHPVHRVQKLLLKLPKRGALPFLLSTGEHGPHYLSTLPLDPAPRARSSRLPRDEAGEVVSGYRDCRVLAQQLEENSRKEWLDSSDDENPTRPLGKRRKADRRRGKVSRNRPYNPLCVLPVRPDRPHRDPGRRSLDQSWRTAIHFGTPSIENGRRSPGGFTASKGTGPKEETGLLPMKALRPPPGPKVGD